MPKVELHMKARRVAFDDVEFLYAGNGVHATTVCADSKVGQLLRPYLPERRPSGLENGDKRPVTITFDFGGDDAVAE